MPFNHRPDASVTSGAAPVDMSEIKYFLAVSETLNFHRAAERCHVTQPALTRAVQKLEAELGGQLFCRDKGRVELTEFGRLMRPHLKEVLERREHARTIARSFLRLEAAPLTLGVMCTIGPTLFVAFLNAFRERHPGVEVTVVENVPARLSELLLNGSLDVALMAQPQAFDPRLKVVPVYRERFGLAFPAGHPFEQRNTLHVTDVRDQTYLSRVNCEYRDYLIELCGEFGVGFHRGFKSEREDWIMTMVAAGMGICFLPEYSALHPGIRHRLVANPEVARMVSVVSVAGRALSPPALAFIDETRSYDWPTSVQGRPAHEVIQ
jgi:LysR family transcriptional regulator, hydrogen peroxide-inducible genes activator